MDDFSEIFLESLITNLSDSHHMRFSQHSGKVHTLKSTLDFVERLLLGGGRYFQILDFSGTEYLGSLTIRPRSSSDCEAGILIFKTAAGQGIGSTVWMELPKMLENSGFRRLIAGCHRDNMAMRSLVKKLGMSEISPSEDKSGNAVPEINIFFSLSFDDVPFS